VYVDRGVRQGTISLAENCLKNMNQAHFLLRCVEVYLDPKIIQATLRSKSHFLINEFGQGIAQSVDAHCADTLVGLPPHPDHSARMIAMDPKVRVGIVDVDPHVDYLRYEALSYTRTLYLSW